MTGQTGIFLQDNRVDDDNEGKHKRKVTIKSIICNNTVKGWFFLTVFAATVPILVYYFLIDQVTFDSNDSYTCLVQSSFRVPCGVVNITADKCEKVYCCYDRSTKTCYHYLPSKYAYQLDESTKEYTPLRSSSPHHTTSIKKLFVAVNEKSEDKVSIIVSQNDVSDQEHRLTEKNYIVRLMEEKLMVEVYRHNEDLLLSTTKGPLIASDNYWEWSFYLSNHTILGLNRTLINAEKNSTLTQVIYKNYVDHSSVPVFWGYNHTSFHGVVIRHEGPLEIVVLPSNLVLLRSLTGGFIELELSVGPTPKLLHDQQTQKVEPPPSWALETHMCRRGSNTNLTELLADYSYDSNANSDCIHENLIIGIMKDNLTNVDSLRSTIKSARESGSRILLSVPPHVLQSLDTLYNKANELNILYKYNNSIYTGRYLNEIVTYPDYSHTNIQEYLTEFHGLLSTYMDIEDIDGFVLHDNWPVNDNYNISINDTYFPYLSQELQEALSFTLPWNSTTSDETVLHIQTHNDYGASQISSFKNYFSNIGKDVFITSSSKSLDQTEPSVVQNVNASWTGLREQIESMLFNSITGNHLVSLPVCGDTTFFRNSLQETLCLRWYLLAATMPMFKISSFEPYRDPNHLNSTFAGNIALNAISLRKTLLPYYYTILSKNEPIVRPMFYDFYDNETTFSLTHQYMVGDSLLITYPLSSGRNTLQVYLPSSVGIWYEFWGGEMFNTTDEAWIDFHIVETDFVAFVAQGYILPLKDTNMFNLIIALNCSTTPCDAKGTLLDNNYISFQSNETAVTISDIPQTNCNYRIGDIDLYYYDSEGPKADFFLKDEDLCTGETSITVFF